MQLSDQSSGLDSRAKLSKRPSTLHDLWAEYESGLGGNKAARLFTSAERGQKEVKFSYCLRKCFWDVVSNMVRRGHTADVAIGKIYGAYGEQLSVTQILRLIRKDRNTGGHPNLRN